jgi:hypothetical protein
MENHIINFKMTVRNSNDYETKTDHTWDLSNQLKIDELLKMKEFANYKKAATIVKADNAAGYTIKIEPEFKNVPFVVYIATWNLFVLKGGKSKNSLDTRSYKAGTEEGWTEGGEPSPTNYIWSQIFRETLKMGIPVVFYAQAVDLIECTYESHGETKTTLISPYEQVEKDLQELLNKLNGKKVIGEGDLKAVFKN